MDHRYR